jgi:hypothetical protein
VNVNGAVIVAIEEEPKAVLGEYCRHRLGFVFFANVESSHALPRARLRRRVEIVTVMMAGTGGGSEVRSDDLLARFLFSGSLGYGFFAVFLIAFLGDVLAVAPLPTLSFCMATGFSIARRLSITLSP